MSVPVQASHEPADLAMLTGAEAEAVLRAALATEGAELERWAVHAVHHRPGAGVTVGYTATVRRDGRGRHDEYLCATTARLSHPDAAGLVRLQASDGAVVHVWRHPADPELPALAVACDAAALSARLNARVTVELLAYRPTRRAVLRVKGGDAATAYLKVVRPAAVETFVARHDLLTSAGVPAPAVLRGDADGLVLLAEGTGTPLANLLSQGMGPGATRARQAAATLDALLAVLDALPAPVMDLRRRPAWADRAMHYAHAAATVMPEHATRIRAVARGVEDLLARTDPGPLVPTHGDFYEANVLMAAAGGVPRVSALLDIDSAGPGHRVDDLACLLGHVSVLPHLAPATYPHVGEILEVWTRRSERVVDPVALNARAAGVVLSLVAGARRTDGRPWRADAEGRLARAETWLARARELLARRAPR